MTHALFESMREKSPDEWAATADFDLLEDVWLFYVNAAALAQRRADALRRIIAGGRRLRELADAGPEEES